MRKILALSLALTLLTFSGWVAAAPVPYDEAANAKADIQAAQAEAKAAKVPLIVVFGANWCGDCKMLDTAFKTGAAAPLMEKNFRVVKVNVGRFHRNTDIAEAYGVPLKKGIPAVAILSEDGKTLYATRSGELADARKMGDAGIYEFFAKVAGQPAQ